MYFIPCSFHHGRRTASTHQKKSKNLKKNQFISKTINHDSIHVRDWISIIAICSMGVQGTLVKITSRSRSCNPLLQLFSNKSELFIRHSTLRIFEPRLTWVSYRPQHIEYAAQQHCLKGCPTTLSQGSFVTLTHRQPTLLHPQKLENTPPNHLLRLWCQWSAQSNQNAAKAKLTWDLSSKHFDQYLFLHSPVAPSMTAARSKY